MNTSSREICVLLSGGIDSAACLAFYLQLGRPVYGMFVDYGQLAAKRELIASQHVAQHYGCELFNFKWQSYLEKASGLIQGRNSFLLSAALMEIPKDVTRVAMGIHKGTNYKDCSREFVERMEEVYNLYTCGKVSIGAPFLKWTKAEIWEFALTQGIPIDKTWSCEASTNFPCGQCLSCIDREALNAFSQKNT